MVLTRSPAVLLARRSAGPPCFSAPPTDLPPIRSSARRGRAPAAPSRDLGRTLPTPSANGLALDDGSRRRPRRRAYSSHVSRACPHATGRIAVFVQRPVRNRHAWMIGARSTIRTATTGRPISAKPPCTAATTRPSHLRDLPRASLGCSTARRLVSDRGPQRYPDFHSYGRPRRPSSVTNYGGPRLVRRVRQGSASCSPPPRLRRL